MEPPHISMLQNHFFSSICSIHELLPVHHWLWLAASLPPRPSPGLSELPTRSSTNVRTSLVHVLRCAKPPNTTKILPLGWASSASCRLWELLLPQCLQLWRAINHGHRKIFLPWLRLNTFYPVLRNRLLCLVHQELKMAAGSYSEPGNDFFSIICQVQTQSNPVWQYLIHLLSNKTLVHWF